MVLFLFHSIFFLYQIEIDSLVAMNAQHLLQLHPVKNPQNFLIFNEKNENRNETELKRSKRRRGREREKKKKKMYCLIVQSHTCTPKKY